VGAFGEKFRTERERRGFTLDNVSSVTKISARMLKAIEDERFDQLPGGVFNKGFIRAYAKHLGLNHEEAVTEYLACLRQAQVDAQSSPWDPGKQPAVHAGKSHAEEPAPRPQAERRSHDRRAHVREAAPPMKALSPRVEPTRPPGADVKTEPSVEPRVQVPVSVPQPVVVARSVPSAASTPGEGDSNSSDSSNYDIPWRIPALVLAVIVIGAFFWTRHVHNARAEGSSAERSAAHAAMAPSGASAPVAASPAAIPPAAKRSAGDDGEENDVASRLPASPRPPALTAPATFTLVIRATENSWISLSADGQLMNQETLIAPAHTSVRASREIVVKAGNAAGVSFLLNGKEIPAQGNEGEVKTFTFDGTGMRPEPAGQSSDIAR
jgi:helix-turn-helix protein/uncharacterized protein DUF4115